MEPKKSSVPSPIEDYANEGYNMISAIYVSAMMLDAAAGSQDELTLLSRLDDAELLTAVTEARQGGDVLPPVQLRTIEERFAPESLQGMRGEDGTKMAAWMAANPETVARNKKLVETINTSDDMPAFRSAMNELFVGIGIDKVAFTVAPPAEGPEDSGPKSGIPGGSPPLKFKR